MCNFIVRGTVLHSLTLGLSESFLVPKATTVH